MYDNLQQVLILAAKREDYEEKLKEILQFYNNEKSYDFNEDSLRTQLRVFSANFPKKDDTNINLHLYVKKLHSHYLYITHINLLLN